MQDVFNELLAYMNGLKVISTHSHHLKDEEFKGLTLKRLIENSYVSWSGLKLEDTYASRKEYIGSLKYKSYFVWLQKALGEIYSMDSPLTADNWELISDKITERHKDTHFHLDLLKNKCKYEKIIIDTYWNPGDNNGHPDLFSPTYRINSFITGYSKEVKDHNGNNPYQYYDADIQDIDEYIQYMKGIIKLKKNEGCVALKSALAYDRGLDFHEVEKGKAQKAFGRKGHAVTQEDIKNFGNYIFFEICKVAAELDMPLQCHTGSGIYHETNALQLYEVISKNPETKFILFHGGYPWTEDLCALTHYFPNVYPDFCWMPLLETPASIRLLDSLIEICLSDRICWGCDTWTSEESYGALLAVRFVLAKTLSQKVTDGYLAINDAKSLISNILYNNPKKLYNTPPCQGGTLSG
jgi:predicted TIM-barrel fold metal-dependent hydrolase